MNKNKICSIVVTYNRCELLIECIEGLLKSEIKADILIIDNASTDGTKEKINKYIKNKDVIYFNTGKNIGGAGGFNFGLRKAYELGYYYYWLMDDDTIIQKTSLTELMKADEKYNGNYGFLSSIAVYTDGEPCVMNWHEIANDWNKRKLDISDGIILIKTATFVSFFLKRDVLEEVGLPIKEYFIWGDDTEYSRRISKKYSCYMVANSRVVHKMKRNQGTYDLADINDIERIKRVIYSIRNDICTYRKQERKWVFIKYIIGMFIKFIKLLFTNCKYKGTKLNIFMTGYIKGIFFNPKIEYVNNITRSR